MATTCYYVLLQTGGKILLQSGGGMRLHIDCVTTPDVEARLGGGAFIEWPLKPRIDDDDEVLVLL